MANVTMPQLGETVADGTVTKWFKKVGDVVVKGEPLFEVSTDKVDTRFVTDQRRAYRHSRRRGRDR